MAENIIFAVLAGLVTTCSIMVVASRNPVTSAIFLVLNLFCLAGVYAQLEAHFVAAIQVLIYAGAIVVLFVFVIMLLNLGTEGIKKIKISPFDLIAFMVCGITFMGVCIALIITTPIESSLELTPEKIETIGGNTFVVGMRLFTQFLWPFELASVLILLAIVASVVIAKKNSDSSDNRISSRRSLQRDT